MRLMKILRNKMVGVREVILLSLSLVIQVLILEIRSGGLLMIILLVLLCR